MTHVPGWFNACDYLELKQHKPLILDDELRDLAAKVRERLALIGPHRELPVYDLTLSCLECGLFYEDSDEIRTKLKGELRDIVGKLDDFLAREGTQREREERHAEAIAADRRKIMGVIREHAGNVVSFKLPMRWFDDWTRAQRDGRWETWPAPKPESLYKWRRKTPEEFGRMQRELFGDWPMIPPRTTAEHEAYVRSFQAQWPERYEDDQPFRRAVNDFRKRNAHLYEGNFRMPSAEEQQPLVEELAKFTYTRQLDSVPNPYTPQETEVLRAWATYLLKTELCDRSGPHEMRNGEAVPVGPHAYRRSMYASQALETTKATCKRLVGADASNRLRREVTDHAHSAARNGDDMVKALERYLAQLPAACDDP